MPASCGCVTCCMNRLETLSTILISCLDANVTETIANMLSKLYNLLQGESFETTTGISIAYGAHIMVRSRLQNYKRNLQMQQVLKRNALTYLCIVSTLTDSCMIVYLCTKNETNLVKINLIRSLEAFLSPNIAGPVPCNLLSLSGINPQHVVNVLESNCQS